MAEPLKRHRYTMEELLDEAAPGWNYISEHERTGYERQNPWLFIEMIGAHWVVAGGDSNTGELPHIDKQWATPQAAMAEIDETIENPTSAQPG